ncbi:MAG: S-methyl-5-thioribose-1-phosphate isomerase [Woeseiaceae bacterium]|nr:S-methyl-5-thioribose-1-phosphate isomerase [Woeseiaceae bacterium]
MITTPGVDAFRSIWLHPDDPSIVQTIDQRRLPHELVILDLRTPDDGVMAIRDMVVRGAPLIGATAAWSVYLAALRGGKAVRDDVSAAADRLAAARPTAVNLRWALDRMRRAIATADVADLADVARREAEAICEEDVEISRGIGEHGLELIKDMAARRNGEPVNVLTHCNAGALATINWGTATAPIYFAQRAGIPVHVWVDETRPRNQGSQLTAWELAQCGIPHTLIVDNAGGHLMQHGRVDLCIVGTDRTTRRGDVANKIGTYLKALAAHDNGIPFYVALPSTTIDWDVSDGLRDIPIEERDPAEVTHITGRAGDDIVTVNTLPTDTAVSNYAFDVTPARLVTGLITEAGVCNASEAGLAGLFPEMAQKAS